MDGLPALDLWEMLIEVLHSINNNAQPKHTSHEETGSVLDSKTETQHLKRRQKVEHLSEVDDVPTNTHSSQGESQLYIFEDNEAVIKMITESCLISCWTESTCTQIRIKYVGTKNQLADILTKGSFSKNEWNHLLCLFNRMSFSMYSCSHFKHFLSKVSEHIVIGAMSKRGQETTSNDGSPTATARPVNLVMHGQCKEEISSSSFGSRVNPVNFDGRQRIGQAPGNWMLGDSKLEAEYSQATRKLGQKDQTQVQSEENPPGTRKLAAYPPEFRKHGIHKPSIHV